MLNMDHRQLPKKRLYRAIIRERRIVMELKETMEGRTEIVLVREGAEEEVEGKGVKEAMMADRNIYQEKKTVTVNLSWTTLVRR